MSQATDKSVIEHPPVVADVEPQKSIGGIKISTTNLRTYTMVFALIVIWVFFHYVSSPNCPCFVWPCIIKGVTQGNTIPIGLGEYKDIGQSYVPPVIGFAIAALAIGAIIWLAFRRTRARARYGLGAPSIVSTAMRIVIPSLVILGFIFALNSYAGVPIPVIILLAIALIGVLLTQNTTFGRYLYAIGGNPDAARLSGISLRRHILMVFCIMGVLAGIAGVIYTARVGSGAPDPGPLLQLDA